MSPLPFTAPFNWCDGRCERCPLASDCPLHRRTEQRRWVHKARGEDPDSAASVVADVTDDLARTLRMLREAAEQEGVDLDAPAPAQPTSIDSVRLRKAWLELCAALAGGLRPLDGASPAQARAAEELRAVCTTLTMKSARVGGYLPAGQDESWAMDAIPNLLLIERLRARLDEILADFAGQLLADDAFATIRRALTTIDRILQPLMKGVGAEPRALLDSLIARGEAPSPFCVVET